MVKIPVVEGSKIGKITIGALVPKEEWRDHPAGRDLPMSYRKGKVRECRCDCGKVILLNEIVLARGTIKRCSDKGAHPTALEALKKQYKYGNHLRDQLRHFKELKDRSVLPEDITRLDAKIAELQEELRSLSLPDNA